MNLPEVTVEVPKNAEYGDFSTNAALLLAKSLRQPPFEIAEKIVAEIKKKPQKIFSEISAFKNGFINFKISFEFLQNNLKTILKEKQKYGRNKTGKGKKVLIEFVSANPTGPLHVGHGRWAVIGDDIASLFEACGYKVDREYYVNDRGNQIKLLEKSVKAAANGSPVPEGGYGGSYIKEIADDLKDHKQLLPYILSKQKETLAKLKVIFDSYFSEKTLHDEGLVEDAISRLSSEGHTIREGGALWFKSEAFGDDKNRVLVKENGELTYFAADIAYHINKFKRGYDIIIDIWGADHHGYVPRVKAALAAVGLPIDRFEVIIGQLVTLYRGKEQVKMSKRTGEMVTLDEIISEIGSDAVRFFMTSTSVNNHLDFDLELAKEKKQENPVYYVQYAHARICSILRKSKCKVQSAKLDTLTHEAERALMRKLLDFEDEILAACRKREPHQLINYVKDVAAIFHNFYHQCRVLDNPARLVLVEATRIVIENVLKLLKIEAPEQM